MYKLTRRRCGPHSEPFSNFFMKRSTSADNRSERLGEEPQRSMKESVQSCVGFVQADLSTTSEFTETPRRKGQNNSGAVPGGNMSFDQDLTRLKYVPCKSNLHLLCNLVHFLHVFTCSPSRHDRPMRGENVCEGTQTASRTTYHICNTSEMFLD